MRRAESAQALLQSKAAVCVCVRRRTLARGCRRFRLNQVNEAKTMKANLTQESLPASAKNPIVKNTKQVTQAVELRNSQEEVRDLLN